MSKCELKVDVLTAARERIAWVFDKFKHVYLSGPSGKDSTVMMHLVCQEARRRKLEVGVLYIDLEAQYKVTIDTVRRMFAEYADCTKPYWVALPLHLRNAVSMTEPYWCCWETSARDKWVRQPEPNSITDTSRFPFYRDAMEFEEFVDEFGDWYGGGEPTACFVGIRSDESLNRWRTIASKKKQRIEDKPWTTRKSPSTCNVYPIYDWCTEDVWTYTARERAIYNPLYDLMHAAGLTPHQMRICQPYGNDQRIGLHLYHVIEPETWSKVVARVAGANHGALYSTESGNILGNRTITLPKGHTWKSYAKFLLESLPASERDDFEDKIAVFLHWYKERGYADGIPDESDPKLEAAKKVPSWRRIVKVILKNDKLCKGLSFSQQSSSAKSRERYKKVMRSRRIEWGVL